MFTCPRCNGKGTIKEYGHIRGGVCFKCSGKGKVNHRPRARVSREDPVMKAENERKHAAAMKLYRNDARLTVGPNHPYFYMHTHELAKLDKVWESL